MCHHLKQEHHLVLFHLWLHHCSLWLRALKGPGGFQPITNYRIKNLRTNTNYFIKCKYYFVAPSRHLSATIAPLLAYPWIVVFRLTLNPNLSWVSSFIFVLTCLSSIAMGTKGIWWKIDENNRNFMGILWKLDENKRILMGYWWEQEEFDCNCLGTWWEITHPFEKIINIPWGHVCATWLAHP